MGRDGTGRVDPLQDRLLSTTVSNIEETLQSPMLPNTEIVEVSSGCEMNENSNFYPFKVKVHNYRHLNLTKDLRALDNMILMVI